jgi:hypothetical protein
MSALAEERRRKPRWESIPIPAELVADGHYPLARSSSWLCPKDFVDPVPSYQYPDRYTHNGYLDQQELLKRRRTKHGPSPALQRLAQVRPAVEITPISRCRSEFYARVTPGETNLRLKEMMTLAQRMEKVIKLGRPRRRPKTWVEEMRDFYRTHPAEARNVERALNEIEIERMREERKRARRSRIDEFARILNPCMQRPRRPVSGVRGRGPGRR